MTSRQPCRAREIASPPPAPGPRASAPLRYRRRRRRRILYRQDPTRDAMPSRLPSTVPFPRQDFPDRETTPAHPNFC